MTPNAAQLRAHEKRIAGMYADPDLVGDLLAVGLVFARSLDFDNPPLNHVVREAGKLIYGRAEHGPHLHRWRYEEQFQRIAQVGHKRVADILRSDIRRYVPDLTRAYFCQRPMRPRPGQEVLAGNLMSDDAQKKPEERRCGRQNAVYERYLFVDVVNGNRHALGACSKPICQRWWNDLRARNEAEIATTPPPEPVANRGGVLERHLDEIDWPAIYQHLDPAWKPPHEAPGWKPPKLQILLNDEPDVTVTQRPALSVIRGGWR